MRHDVPEESPQWQSPHLSRVVLCLIATESYKVPKTGTVIHHFTVPCSSESSENPQRARHMTIHGCFVFFLNLQWFLEMPPLLCPLHKAFFLVIWSSYSDISTEVTWSIDSFGCSLCETSRALFYDPPTYHHSDACAQNPCLMKTVPLTSGNLEKYPTSHNV